MEAHCIALELKYQNQALKSRQHGQILNEESNKAKIKKEIDVLETMNIELEHSVAKLRKENETLKKHYKDLYDSIEITRSKTIEQKTSLLSNNDDLKAQIHEKVFAIAALKNDLRKLKGNSVDTKFAKTSVLGKPVLHPLKNQSVVTQPNAFKYGRPQMSKQRFASQVDKEVNSRAKIQSYKTRNRNKPVHQKSHTQIPGRQIFTGHRFSPNKTFAVYEKTSSRSDLRWKPTSRIFKYGGLRWIPTRKLSDSCTSKVDSEPTHSSNVDNPNIHESKQTLDLSAKVPSTDTIVMTSMIELKRLFGPLFDEYFNGENQVVSKSFAVTTADASIKRQQQQDSTSSTSTLPTTVTADGHFAL
nr:hypothetical protein [Tanacetum cinerariifolium]